MGHPPPHHIEEQEEADDGEDSDSEEDNNDASGGEHKKMTTVSRHHFGHSFSTGDVDNYDYEHDVDDNDGEHEEGFFVDIIENMQENYGLFVWSCSIVLAEYVWKQRARFLGRSVVEIGAGTSLPGLVAAKVGADVILTDKNKTEILDNMRKTIEMNNLHCKISSLDWGEWDESLFDIIPDIVLGADIFYDTRDFEDVFSSVTFLLQRSPRSVFITAYDNRSGHHLIEYLMVKWRWKCTRLLDAFSFMPSSKAVKLQGNIQLVEIMLDTER